jgi:hypothetical protein
VVEGRTPHTATGALAVRSVRPATGADDGPYASVHAWRTSGALHRSRPYSASSRTRGLPSTGARWPRARRCRWKDSAGPSPCRGGFRSIRPAIACRSRQCVGEVASPQQGGAFADQTVGGVGFHTVVGANGQAEWRSCALRTPAGRTGGPASRSRRCWTPSARRDRTCRARRALSTRAGQAARIATGMGQRGQGYRSRVEAREAEARSRGVAESRRTMRDQFEDGVEVAVHPGENSQARRPGGTREVCPPGCSWVSGGRRGFLG